MSDTSERERIIAMLTRNGGGLIIILILLFGIWDYLKAEQELAHAALTQCLALEPYAASKKSSPGSPATASR